MKRFKTAGSVVAATMLGMVLAPAAQATPEQDGRPFNPTPISEPIYAVSETTDQRRVPSGDTELFLETWLPVARDGGPQPPERLPTVLIMTPYAMERRISEGYVAARNILVPRGYAFSVMHTRGFGSSGGCPVLLGEEEARDGATVIEYIATQAPWSDGVIGTFGSSYLGGTQIATAAGGAPAQLRYLKAMVVGNPAASWYDVGNHDGVPSYLETAFNAHYYAHKTLFPYTGPYEAAFDLAGESAAELEYGLSARTSPGGTPVERWPDRAACQPEHFEASLDRSGDVTPYYAERDWRRGIANITAPTMMFHGHLDRSVPTHVQAGLFDRITAPKFGIFGDFGHRAALGHVDPEPSRLSPRSPSAAPRPDFWDSVVAWYDQHLKGLDAGTESWPVAQVEGNDGLWRAEPNWPATGGPAGQLVLGEGTLGSEPSGDGSSTYTESLLPLDRGSGLRPEGSYVAFDSGPVDDRLEITGMPVLDLWVELDKPDAHIAAEIETFDANGDPIETASRSGTTVGFRSMQHLEPFINGRFVQAEPQEAPTGEPIHTVVRFRPVDLVIPPGGSVRLTIAGQQRWVRVDLPTEHPSWPSLSNTTVTVLHDCEHMSALRFVMPRERFDLLDVATLEDEDVAEAGPPYGNAHGQTPRIVSDGGGIATEPVCGQSPVRFDEFFGPESK